MTRGARKLVIPGVYSDRIGFEARARAAGRTQAKRFPKSATLKAMKQWQDDTRKALRKAARDQTSDLPPGTLAGDLVIHLATLPEQRRRESKAEYTAWLTPALKSRPRASITLEELRTLVSTWADAGIAASTINHRIRALRALYEALDGDDVPVLPRRLARLPEPPPANRAADMDLLTAILAEMRDYPDPRHPREPSKAKARLRLMQWTGVTAATMQRVGAHGIDLARKEIRLPPRMKGRGSPAVTLPLVDPEGVTAARDWLRAHAWFRFDRTRLGVRFKQAVAAFGAKHPDVSIPPGLHMYDLRHSFLTWLATKTVTPETPAGNPYVVMLYAQHKNLETTKRYMQAVIPEMVRQVLAVPRPVPRKRP